MKGQKVSGTKLTNSWSSAGSSRDFQAKSPCRLGEPGIVSERAATVEAALDRGKLFIRLRRIHMLHPSRRSSYRPTRQQRFLFRCSAMPAVEAAPPPLFGMQDEIRPQRVSFHVSADRQKMLIVLDRKGLETSLVQMPQSRRLSMSMPALRMR